MVKASGGDLDSLPSNWSVWRIVWHYRKLYSVLAFVRVAQVVAGFLGYRLKRR